MTPTAKCNSHSTLNKADPESLTPHERLSEITAILATGVHRLRAITPVTPESGEISRESSQAGLEAVATSSPYGSERQPERTLET